MNPTSYALLSRDCTLALSPQPLYLEPEGIVLFDLPCQEMSRELGLGGDPLRSKEVGVATLVRAVVEVLDLHEPLAEQRSKQIVRLAEAHSKFVRHLALRPVRARIEKTKDTQKRGIGHGAQMERTGVC